MNNISSTCQKCSKNFKSNKEHDPYKEYLFCKDCLTNMKIISKTKVKQTFYLKDNDLRSIKYINTYYNYQFFLYDDIHQIIINKYGSFDNFKKIISERSRKENERVDKKQKIKIEREKKLKEILKYNKLEYKPYGDCYSYVHFGIPDINDVVENELNKIQNINTKRINLSSELKKKGIKFNENLKPCYDYVYNLNDKTLNETVRETEIEIFLKNNTNYKELIKIYPHEKAQEIALYKYGIKNNKGMSKFVISRTTI